MKLLLILALLCPYVLGAQISVLIEDERGDGFFLGINGYVQNEEKKTKLLIKSLDTARYTFSIRCGLTEFSKVIQLREKGLHKYVLVEDFYGKPKLRYRGIQAGTPGGVSVITMQSVIPWPDMTSETIVAEVVRDTVTDTSMTTMAVVAATPVVPASVDSMASDNTEVVLVQDSVADTAAADIIETADTLISTPVEDTEGFRNFLSGLKAQEFEFDKLTMCQEYSSANNLSSEQLGLMFSELRYDQSRMQLIRSALDQIVDPENLEELASHFEYEITKSQYILFLNE